jgi:mannose-6-phosphate isomerase-like protein (cupin superfamily)
LNLRKDITPDYLKELLTQQGGNPPSQEELDKTEEALLVFAEAHAVTPPLSLKDKILSKIQKLNDETQNKQAFTLENLPILTPESNWLEWKEAVKHIPLPDEFEGVHLHSIESNEKRDLFVAWVKEVVPEEVHHDLLESFILLEGTCECEITDETGNIRTVTMREGDYIAFKLGETHIINITSAQPAKAILQWLKLAA